MKELFHRFPNLPFWLRAANFSGTLPSSKGGGSRGRYLCCTLLKFRKKIPFPNCTDTLSHDPHFFFFSVSFFVCFNVKSSNHSLPFLYLKKKKILGPCCSGLQHFLKSGLKRHLQNTLVRCFLIHINTVYIYTLYKYLPFWCMGSSYDYMYCCFLMYHILYRGL